jgi:hypothetical protein
VLVNAATSEVVRAATLAVDNPEIDVFAASWQCGHPGGPGV